MSVELTRKTVGAIIAESTVGTPVIPSSATDFIELQDGAFELTPEFEVLENAELRASIGSAKPIIGLENPTGSMSHYLRHSGVEGTAPNYSELIETAFGAKVVNATQYDTISGSTAGTSTARAVIKVDTGEGAAHQRGQALLIKDATNGYAIRNVYSVSSDDLSLGFNLANAPAVSTNLGKCIQYKPADSFPSFTWWLYRANGNSTEMMSGVRVSEMSIDVTAGEFINTSFSLEGSYYYFDPINITATDTKLDFLDDATTRVATVTAQVYRDPHQLADAIATSMNALGSSNTFTCTYSNTTGKFTITSSGTTLTLKWSSGANTANTIGDKIGFNTGSDDSAALTYTSDNAQSFVAPYTPSFDSSSPLVAKDNEVMIGAYSNYACFCVQNMTFTLSNEIQPVPCVCSESGISEKVPTGRVVTVEMTAILEKYDAQKFKDFREGNTISFAYNFGTQTGGNWTAGKCGNIYIPDATITAFQVTDSDGIVALSMTIQAFVDSNGNGEVYLNFV